jgi:hypothetical protein
MQTRALLHRLVSVTVATAAGISLAAGSLRAQEDLYISNNSADDIIAFNALTGAYAGVFIAPGSGVCVGMQ